MSSFFIFIEASCLPYYLIVDQSHNCHFLYELGIIK